MATRILAIVMHCNMFSRTSITAIGSDGTTTPPPRPAPPLPGFGLFAPECSVYHLLVECTLRSISELSLVVVVIVVF